jgi:hypothetical protein
MFHCVLVGARGAPVSDLALKAGQLGDGELELVQTEAEEAGRRGGGRCGWGGECCGCGCGDIVGNGGVDGAVEGENVSL